MKYILLLIKKYYMEGGSLQSVCVISLTCQTIVFSYYTYNIPLLNSRDSKVTNLTMSPTFFKFDFYFNNCFRFHNCITRYDKTVPI